MHVCLGGTFDLLHAGHEALLLAACEDAEELFVGVTVDELANRQDRQVAPWKERADAVSNFIKKSGFEGKLTVNPLNDRQGPAASGDYQRIVVSPETMPGAQAINDARRKSNLPELDVKMVQHVLAQDLLPISATRIRSGIIDKQGTRSTPIVISLGSNNPVKRGGVEQACRQIFKSLECRVPCHDVDSQVPEQPTKREILVGARNRANAAAKAHNGADYAIGIEAGLDQDEDGAWYDVQSCVILDSQNRETVGHGPAFSYPDWVTKRALNGEMISQILGPIADDAQIGGTTGAIGFLTEGRYNRADLTEQAVLMAFVPRLKRHLYDLANLPK